MSELLSPAVELSKSEEHPQPTTQIASDPSLPESSQDNWEDYLPPLWGEKKTSSSESEETSLERDRAESEEIPEDPYQIRTKQTFVTNPYAKGTLVLAVVSGGVLGLSGLFQWITGGFPNNNGTNPTPSPTQTPIASFPTDSSELANNQARLQQAQKIEQARQRQLQENPSLPSIQKPPAVKSAPVVIRQTSLPAPKMVSSVIQRPKPVSTPVRQTQTQVSLPKQNQVQDPLAQWQALADLGSYGSVIPEPAEPNESETETPEFAESFARIASQESPPTEESEKLQEKLDSATKNSSQILIGAGAQAELESAIVWAGALQNPEQRFLINLTEPIVGSDGKEVISSGTELIATIKEASEAGLLTMEVIAVRVEENGRQVDRSVPGGAILILGEEGGILQAEERSPDTLEGDLLASLLNGVANAASLSNRARSQTFTNFGSSSSYDRADPLSGLIEGITGNMAQSLSERGQQARDSARSKSSVFVLEAGTVVRVYVNKSLNF